MEPIKCLVTDCPHPAKTRGLCVACEQAAVRAVAYGRTTWEELFKLGLALEPNWNRPTNLINSSRLMRALKKARLGVQRRKHP